MAHPLVDQLRFARSEFLRGLGEVADPEAQQRFGSMNCLSWIVGHLAWQEQRYWLYRGQGQVLIPLLNDLLAYGKPACTPAVDEMWAAWRQVTQAADPWLDALTAETLQQPLVEGFSSVGTFLQRNIYHYWYHLGEGMAVRQLLGNQGLPGHTGLPDFVGDIDSQAPYRPDSGGQASEPLDKAHFLEKVRQARARWEALVAEIDDKRMLQPGASGDWTLKDVLAHLTWHEREMLGVLNARALTGSEWWNLPLDQRNQLIYEAHRDLPLERVRAEAQETYSRLLQALEGLAEEDLHDPGRFAEMPPEWQPWKLLAENTYEHYIDHFLSLKEWVKRISSSNNNS
jgi:uncharacterized damage-inducible protein DinB